VCSGIDHIGNVLLAGIETEKPPSFGYHYGRGHTRTSRCGVVRLVAKFGDGARGEAGQREDMGEDLAFS
jgi:hypothetical protein